RPAPGARAVLATPGFARQGAGMKERDADRPALAQARRGALLLAGLLALMAAWFAWSGVQQWQGDQRLAQLEQARDQAVTATAGAVAAQTRALTSRLERPEVSAALQAGDAQAAATALSADWRQAAAASVLRADLAAAHADAAAFGYARLALLQRALAEGSAVAAVVREGKITALGLAAPAQLGGEDAVAYVRVPLGVLTAGFAGAPVPEGAYLALRQGTYNVTEHGDLGMAGSADVLSRPVGQSGLRAAAAVPDVAAGPFGLGAVPCLVGAGLLVLLVLACLLAAAGKLPRR